MESNKFESVNNILRKEQIISEFNDYFQTTSWSHDLFKEQILNLLDDPELQDQILNLLNDDQKFHEQILNPLKQILNQVISILESDLKFHNQMQDILHRNSPEFLNFIKDLSNSLDFINSFNNSEFCFDDRPLNDSLDFLNSWSLNFIEKILNLNEGYFNWGYYYLKALLDNNNLEYHDQIKNLLSDNSEFHNQIKDLLNGDSKLYD